MTDRALVRADDLRRSFPLPRTRIRGPRPRLEALAGVSLELAAGATLGIVGESGSGKTTLARMLVGLDVPTSGAVVFDGRRVDATRPRRLRWLRSQVQMVFQDPASSLDPRMTVEQSIIEPLRCLAVEDDHRRRIDEVLEVVGLGPWARSRLPHELSGGQQQRVAIARAIAPKPRLLVGDELVSSLDVSVRLQVLDLLRTLVSDTGMGLILISHDLGVVRYLCDDVAVLRAGVVVEQGPADALLSAPRHAYTRSLVAAVPRLPH